MPYTEGWVETDPDGSVISVSQLDDSIRQAKRAIRERMETLVGIGNWGTVDPLIITNPNFAGTTTIDDLHVTDDVTIDGDSTFTGGIIVGGVAQFNGGAQINTGDFNIGTSGNLIVNAGGDIKVNTNKFTVDGATGDTIIAGLTDHQGVAQVQGANDTVPISLKCATGHDLSINNNVTTGLAVGFQWGAILCTNTLTSNMALFLVNVSGVATLIGQTGAEFTVVGATAGKINLIYTGGKWSFENKTGATVIIKTITISFAISP